MNLGVDTSYTITCAKCNRGEYFDLPKIPVNPLFWQQQYTCECGSSFTNLDGILNGYCSMHTFQDYNFISNIVKSGLAEIKVGTVAEIDLDEPIPIVNKVFVTCYDKVAFVQPRLVEGDHILRLISSEYRLASVTPNEIGTQVGEIQKVSWTVYGRSADIQMDPWRRLLVHSKEQFLNYNYLLSFLTSAMALESYLNHQFGEKLIEKGLDEVSISIFQRESLMHDKLFRLPTSLLGIDIGSFGVSKTTLNKIFETRNQIAHGKKVEMESEEAKSTVIAVIRVIFLMEHSLGKFWQLPQW